MSFADDGFSDDGWVEPADPAPEISVEHDTFYLVALAPEDEVEQSPCLDLVADLIAPHGELGHNPALNVAGVSADSVAGALDLTFDTEF